MVPSSTIGINYCSRCNSSSFFTDEKRGEVICMDCGVVSCSNMLDFSPEWRQVDKEGMTNTLAIDRAAPDRSRPGRSITDSFFRGSGSKAMNKIYLETAAGKASLRKQRLFERLTTTCKRLRVTKTTEVSSSTPLFHQLRRT